jgi:hypothetical protein
MGGSAGGGSSLEPDGAWKPCDQKAVELRVGEVDIVGSSRNVYQTDCRYLKALWL